MSLSFVLILSGSRDISAGKEIRLCAGRPRNYGQIPATAKRFNLFSKTASPPLGPTQHRSQLVPAYVPTSGGGGRKERPGRKVDHSPPPSVEVKNEWS